jgi:hypothetical protein
MLEGGEIKPSEGAVLNLTWQQNIWSQEAALEQYGRHNLYCSFYSDNQIMGFLLAEGGGSDVAHHGNIQSPCSLLLNLFSGSTSDCPSLQYHQLCLHPTQML